VDLGYLRIGWLVGGIVWSFSLWGEWMTALGLGASFAAC